MKDGFTRYNSFEVDKKRSHNMYAMDGALVVVNVFKQI
jgi:hypothetical protein